MANHIFSSPLPPGAIDKKIKELIRDTKWVARKQRVWLNHQHPPATDWQREAIDFNEQVIVDQLTAMLSTNKDTQ
jgi:hypothetical protein